MIFRTMDRERLLTSAKNLSETYLKMLLGIAISMLIHYVIFMIFQIIDYFTETFTFHEEVFMFYILRQIFFVLHLISIIIFLVIDGIYIKTHIVDEKEDLTESPSNILSFIKLNITLFIIWGTILFGTAFPRIYLLMTNGEVIGGFTKALIYIKMPFVIGIYLHALVFYTIYKEITKLIEKFGEEALE